MIVYRPPGIGHGKVNGSAFARMIERHGHLVEHALSRLFNSKTTTFLLAIFPQFEGSPALQSLIMSLFLVASGTATHLLKSLIYAQASTFRHVFKPLLG
jgi:threonine/homoserine/homoserine lactone efflux protein